MKTTERLQELLSVAEQCAGPFQSALHEVTWREEFRQRFTPTTCAELVREVMRLKSDAEYLRELVNDLTDTGKCCYDHHGNCQEHGWFTPGVECPHARAQKLWDENGIEVAINS